MFVRKMWFTKPVQIVFEFRQFLAHSSSTKKCEIINFTVHMNRKFFLCRYKLSPLKYTISKFETFGVKIGDVTGVQSYAFCPENWSSNRAAKRPKCHVM